MLAPKKNDSCSRKTALLRNQRAVFISFYRQLPIIKILEILAQKKNLYHNRQRKLKCVLSWRKVKNNYRCTEIFIKELACKEKYIHFYILKSVANAYLISI